MGSCGNSPSLLWLLLADIINKKKDLVYNFDYLQKIHELEMNYFDFVIEKVRLKDTDNHVKITVEKMLDVLKLLLEYTQDQNYQKEIDSCKKYLTDDNPVNPSDDLTEDMLEDDTSREIYLLEFTYGRNQCQYAYSLIQKVEIELVNINTLYSTVRSMFYNTMKYIFSSIDYVEVCPENAFKLMINYYENDRNHIAHSLQRKTIKEVRPSQQAITMWFNFGIY
ncbi:hypothetical protein [Acanthamoeba polyphaga mimivirus]|uniref:Uncharacterized protein n=1 Tax=Acanthamoeba polyphaga mimivirus TaxID=212035 RepID=A0A0G2Y1A1_MIMIV|nr:hypothetical protein [Acanthamoeba castellanii mamavirus]AKI79468.1 hypothetical protein [Acanthamoeba polyphaga mimivirus]UMZ07769.1 hypothetical protein [Acanthamoeba polyphaga mimivirus]